MLVCAVNQQYVYLYSLLNLRLAAHPSHPSRASQSGAELPVLHSRFAPGICFTHLKIVTQLWKELLLYLCYVNNDLGYFRGEKGTHRIGLSHTRIIGLSHRVSTRYYQLKMLVC